jgi:hypothetical protein
MPCKFEEKGLVGYHLTSPFPLFTDLLLSKIHPTSFPTCIARLETTARPFSPTQKNSSSVFITSHMKTAHLQPLHDEQDKIRIPFSVSTQAALSYFTSQKVEQKPSSQPQHKNHTSPISNCPKTLNSKLLTRSTLHPSHRSSPACGNGESRDLACIVRLEILREERGPCRC